MTTVAQLPMLAAMALTDEVPDNQLLRGQVGTVVEALAPGVYEVEFSDNSGRTYASIALSGDRLLRLLHEPASLAA